MKRVRKQKIKPGLHPLNMAVRELRDAAHLSQADMAEQVGLAPMTWSKFERGASVPKDPGTLARLRDAARDFGCPGAWKLLNEAIQETLATTTQSIAAVARIQPTVPRIWKLTQAARIAATYFPEEEGRAMEQAAGRVMALVNEVISKVPQPETLDIDFYREVERQINAAAEKSAFGLLYALAYGNSGEPEKNR